MIGKILRKIFILVYLCISIFGLIYYLGKEIRLTNHAMIRVEERGIAFPDQVHSTLTSGKVKKFGERGIKFIKKSKNGSIICIGEDLGHIIIIKTIE